MKTYKRILLVMFCFVIIFSFAGCSIGEKKAVKTSVEGILNSFKNFSQEEYEKYAARDSQYMPNENKYLPEMIFAVDGDLAEYLKASFAFDTWEIGEIALDGDVGTVDVVIHGYDFAHVKNLALEKFLADVAEGSRERSDAEAVSTLLIAEVVKEGKMEKKDFNVTLDVGKVENRWFVKVGDKLFDPLCGGMLTDEVGDTEEASSDLGE